VFTALMPGLFRYQSFITAQKERTPVAVE